MNIPDAHRLYIMGDLHQALNRACAMIKTIQKPATLIMLGDYDAYESERLKNLANYMKSEGASVILIRGNHDNPEFWQNRVVAEELGSDSFYLAKEVDVINWRGKRILTVSGATSIDRKCVRYDIGKCWPESESVPKDAITQVGALNQGGGAFDILLTHTGILRDHPISAPFVQSYACSDDDLNNDLEAESVLIKQIRIASGVTDHYFGHFHTSRGEDQEGVKVRCLDIAELIEIT